MISVPPAIGMKLQDNPSKFQIWYKMVCTLAASLCPEISTYGLLYLVLPAALYATFPNNFNGEGQPIPPPNPVRPENPAGNAGGGTVQLYRDGLAVFLDFLTKKEALRQAIIQSLGEDIEKTQTDPITGIVMHNSNILMANMQAKYGAVTAADHAALRLSLATPLTAQDHQTHSTHAAIFQDITAQMARAGQPMSQYDLQTIYMETAVHQPVAHAAMLDYIKLNPNLGDRTLAGMIAYTDLQLVNIPAGPAGYANAVNTIPNTSAIVQEVITALGTMGIFPPAAAGIPQVTAAPRNTKHARQANRQGNTQAAGPLLYCYYHGSMGHRGTDCRHMATNPHFTRAMRQSRSPTEVPGGHV